MRPPVPLLFALLVTAPLLAGCVDEDTPDPGPALVPTLTPEVATLELDALVLPELDLLPEMGKDARLWIKHYATTYADRISFTPMNDGANRYLYDELDRLGYEVRMIEYGPEVLGGASPVTYKVIEGRRAGTVEPDRHIGLLAHHDAKYSSNEAAYDDGSGTAAVMALAKYFAEVDTRKSVVVLFFDGEELGLKASCYYSNDLAKDGARIFDIFFGYDMVGINWPGHDWGMYLMMGGAEHLETLLPMAEHVFQDTYDLSAEGAVLLDVHDRNSDERRFREGGLPIYRWAGGRKAADYPYYHQPNDTYLNMIGFAGGEAAFDAGMSMVIRTSIAMFHAADQWAFPPLRPKEQPCSFVGDDTGPL